MLPHATAGSISYGQQDFHSGFKAVISETMGVSLITSSWKFIEYCIKVQLTSKYSFNFYIMLSLLYLYFVSIIPVLCCLYYTCIMLSLLYLYYVVSIIPVLCCLYYTCILFYSCELVIIEMPVVSKITCQIISVTAKR